MDIVVREDRNRVEVRMRGAIDLGRVEQAYRDMLAHPEFRPGMDALWEFVDVEGPALSADDVRRLVAVQRENVARRGAARVAIVVGRELDYGIVRMYEALVHVVPQTVRPFRDRAAAERWLDTPPAAPEVGG